MTPTHPLVRKLSRSLALSETEASIVSEIPVQHRRFGRGDSMVWQGDHPTNCFIVESGLSCREKVVAGDKRQISAINVPGDVPDLQGVFLDVIDHNIAALSSCEVAFFPHKSVIDLFERAPRVAAVFWRELLIEAAIYREWLANLASREAVPRLASFVCEMAIRLKVAGVSDGYKLPFPLTQAEIGNILGISLVHTNRCIATLREEQLVVFAERKVRIIDWQRLQQRGDYDPSYLQLSGKDKEGLPIT
jgi:CRP-like cAMP-binding protein